MKLNGSFRAALLIALVSFQVNAQAQIPLDIAQRSAEYKQSIALQLSTHYHEIESSLLSQINETKLAVPLSTLITRNKSEIFSTNIEKVEHDYLLLKGINGHGKDILEVRLADPNMIKSWKNGKKPFFAFEPAGDDANWTAIEAYDVDGQIHTFNVYEMPNVPVFVVDANNQYELRAGLKTMQEEMNKLGQKSELLLPDSQKSLDIASINRSALKNPQEKALSTTQLTKIRLNYDNEPWITGKAEVYAIITGIDASRATPQIDLVEMPYLDYDGQDYYPEQTMIIWPRYRWGAVDLILMEQDDGTDYKALAKLIVEAADEILKMIPNPEVQGYTVITQITSKIIDIIPDGALTNDDDHIDTFYTIMQNTSYIDRPGASGNAIATFKPIVISPTK